MATAQQQAPYAVAAADPDAALDGGDAGRALAALDAVESELAAMREQRHRLEVAEARLWAHRNQLEQVLIQTRGVDWWRAHRRPLRSIGSADGQQAYE